MKYPGVNIIGPFGWSALGIVVALLLTHRLVDPKMVTDKIEEAHFTSFHEGLAKGRQECVDDGIERERGRREAAESICNFVPRDKNLEACAPWLIP